MKVGFYKSELSDVVGNYDIDDEDLIEKTAKDFAEENHQIDEISDLNFSVYVMDDAGVIYQVKFYTEYDPRVEVDDVKVLEK